MAKDRRIARMKELIPILNEASKAYYTQNIEIMSNLEFDALYEELENLEKETGVVLAGSPTVLVGYETVGALPKEAHEQKMLSLSKTKDREEMRAFIDSQKSLMSFKLDGLTVVLTYDNGELIKAVTRGNGIVGDIVTPNARVFRNIPLKIAFKGVLVLRGEAVITYPDFERINNSLGESVAQYKNPRNLCSGSVRQLNSEVTAKRNVRFYAFSLVRADGVDFHNSRLEQFRFLEEQGFDVVKHVVTTADNLDGTFAFFENKVKTFDVPSDGLVALYDDITYGESLGSTAKSPRDSLAFKWRDEQAETRLIGIEWSPSRTGLINPIAIFDPVELEGTRVSRASVHNISVMRSLKLGVGDTITVYKANMIIPQIAEDLTKSGNIEIPDRCPACGMPTSIHAGNGTLVLSCDNPDCAAKKIKSFTQFVSRDAMNIEGLSEMTLQKFIGRGFIHCYGDLFRLKKFHSQIVEMDGFGEKSTDNLEACIEKARVTTLQRLLFALGIPYIGIANAGIISRSFNGDLNAVRAATQEDFVRIEGIGQVMARSICLWFADDKNKTSLDDLLTQINIIPIFDQNSRSLSLRDHSLVDGKLFVITGKLQHYRSRGDLQSDIENAGGSVSASVSKNTDYLITNDTSSGSNKNVTAKKLGIPVVTEDEFLKMLHSVNKSD